MKEIVAAIYTKLASVQSGGSFHALLQGRYFHMEGPQNIGFPHCVYSLAGVDNQDQFGGSRIVSGAVSFDIYCEAKAGAAVAMDIEEALFALLDQSELASGGAYGTLSVQCVSRGVPSATDEFIIMSTTYSIYTTRSA